jgi:hypothetical protein
MEDPLAQGIGDHNGGRAAFDRVIGLTSIPG